MNIAGSFIALVGSGASDDWRVVLGLIAVVAGLVLLPLAFAKLSGSLGAFPPRHTDPPRANGRAGWWRRVPFIPSSW